MAEPSRYLLLTAPSRRRRRPARYRSNLWGVHPTFPEWTEIIPNARGILVWLGWLRISFTGIDDR